MSDQQNRWQIILAHQPEQMLLRLSPDALRRIDQALLALAETPYPFTSRPILGQSNLYRLQVNEWQITYSVRASRLFIMILEISLEHYPERYALENEAEEGGAAPAETLVQPQLPPKLKESLPKVGSPAKVRLLIVDDVPETRENLRRLLFFEGDIELVGTAADGEAALKMAIEQQPDLILMDVVLPGMDGITTTEKILAQLPATKVIMMSVQGDSNTFRRAMLAGASELLIKPFSSDELVESIWRVCSLSNDSVDQAQPGLKEAFQESVAKNWRRIRPDYGLLEGRGSENYRNFTATMLRQLVTELDKEDETSYPREATWYALQCYAGEGDKVKQNLLHRIEVMGLQDKIFRVTVLNERKAATNVPALPLNFLGCVFVKLLLDEDSWYVVKNTPGVIGWSNLEDKSPRFTPNRQGSLLKRLKKQQTQSETYPLKVATHNLQAYKLGQHVEISLSVTDVEQSLSFYEKLGLRQVDGGDNPYRWAVLSDGILHLGLHQTPFPSPTLNYFASYTPDQLQALHTLNIPLNKVQQIDKTCGMQNGEILKRVFMIAAEFQGLEGQRVSLISRNCEVEPNLGRNFYSTCEKFGELSFKTPDLAASLSYWAKFGFECVSQQATPYSWAVVSDGLIRLGFHQTDKFSKPIITYFAPDMPKRLEGLRQAGLRLISERTDATGQPLGAAIQSPDGQPFLLFSGQISPDF